MTYPHDAYRERDETKYDAFAEGGNLRQLKTTFALSPEGGLRYVAAAAPRCTRPQSSGNYRTRTRGPFLDWTRGEDSLRVQSSCKY